MSRAAALDRLADQVTALRRELALAQEARLEAELRAEGLRNALRQAEQSDTMGTRNGGGADLECCYCGAVIVVRDGSERTAPEPHRSECHFAALAAPPPDLGPLRELVLAAAPEARPDPPRTGSCSST